MLPLPNSANSSPTLSHQWANEINYQDDVDRPHNNNFSNGTHKRHGSLSSSSPLALLRQLVRNPSLTTVRKVSAQLPRWYKYVFGTMTVLLLYWTVFSSRHDRSAGDIVARRGYRAGKNGDARGIRKGHTKLEWRRMAEAVNWGDHVGLGRARQQVLERTPKDYVDISDGGEDGPVGELYRSRRTLSEILRDGKDVEDSAADKKAKKAKLAKRNWAFEQDRHGVLGGASTEWSSGVVGSGTYLGDHVDMRKESSFGEKDDDTRDESKFEAPARDVLVGHILKWGWEYLDEEDRTNTEKMMAQAEEEGWWDALPLREQVRNDTGRRLEAAVSWSRVYTASEGQWKKSALEVQLEKMVRRHPIVVFSKTTCP